MWDSVPGQPAAVRRLARLAQHPVHAYLFTGPPGVGKEEAARAFAAALVCPDRGCGTCRSCSAAMTSHHPDIVQVERTGAAITVDQARELIGTAFRMPVNSERTVVILPDFHLVDEAAPALLKTVEEPPPSTVFVILADTVTPHLVTIASRCVEVEFAPLSAAEVAAALESDGVDPAEAARLAALSGGRLDRARRAASDPSVVRRHELWRSVPERVGGSGAAIAALASGLLESVEEALVPLTARQGEEVSEVAQLAAAGRPVPAKADIAARHKREQRRVRTEEMRFGMATLAGAYRDRLEACRTSRPGGREVESWMRAVGYVDEAAASLDRNPSEVLLVQALLVRLAGLV